MIQNIKRFLYRIYLYTECWILPKRFQERIDSFKQVKILENHNAQGIKRWITGYYTFSQVKRGDLKKNQGDVVIVNLNTDNCIPLIEYLEPIFYIEKIEQEGIYTNIFFKREVFIKIIDLINK
jgi:hypothetical protein